MNIPPYFPLLVSLSCILFGLWQFIKHSHYSIKKNKAQIISELIHDGLTAFSYRVISSIIQIMLYSVILISILSVLFGKPILWNQFISFSLGATIMCLVSYVCLQITPKLAIMTIQQNTEFLEAGIKNTYSASSSIGFITSGFVTSGFLISFYWLDTLSIIGYGLGLILASFFLRIGSGLFKASSGIGHDISSNYDTSLKSNDPRNVSSLLKIVGEYVHKIIGYSSDILGSYIFGLIAAVAFPYFLAQTKAISQATADALINIPITILTIGLLASYGCYAMGRLRIRSGRYANFLLESLYFGIALCGVLIGWLLFRLPKMVSYIPFLDGSNHFNPLAAYSAGLIGAAIICFASEYVTSFRFPPTRSATKDAEYGSVITSLNSLSIGAKSTGLNIMILLLILIPSYYMSGLYGLIMATLGIVSMVSGILTIHFYAPLAKNNFVIARLSESSERIIQNSKKIDRIGHTTVSLGNGFTTAASAMSSLSLSISLIFLIEFKSTQIISLNSEFLIGLLLGTTLPFFVSGLLIRTLKMLIQSIIKVSAIQLRDIPYLSENKATADIIKATDNHASNSMHYLIASGIVLVAIPITIGFLLGVKFLVGLSLGTFLIGINSATLFGSFGDVAYNIRTYIENGHFGGTQTPTYTNAVSSDNVGSALKDLLSPSISIMVKSLVIITLLMSVII